MDEPLNGTAIDSHSSFLPQMGKCSRVYFLLVKEDPLGATTNQVDVGSSRMRSDGAHCFDIATETKTLGHCDAQYQRLLIYCHLKPPALVLYNQRFLRKSGKTNRTESSRLMQNLFVLLVYITSLSVWLGCCYLLCIF